MNTTVNNIAVFYEDLTIIIATSYVQSSFHNRWQILPTTESSLQLFAIELKMHTL